MIEGNCRLNKDDLPIMPCSCKDCVWFINDLDYNNCFWVVSSFMGNVDGWGGFSDEEISRLEGITLQEVNSIIEAAMRSIRIHCKKDLINMS